MATPEPVHSAAGSAQPVNLFLCHEGDCCAAGRASPALRPSHARFGPAALCLRALLDDLLQRLSPLQVQLAASAPLGAAAGPTPAPEMLAAIGARLLPTSPLPDMTSQGTVCAEPLQGVDLRTTGVAEQGGGCSGVADEGAAGSMAERSVRAEGELDARFLLLCCPGLEQARQVLQVGAFSFL